MYNNNFQIHKIVNDIYITLQLLLCFECLCYYTINTRILLIDFCKFYFVDDKRILYLLLHVKNA